MQKSMVHRKSCVLAAAKLKSQSRNTTVEKKWSIAKTRDNNVPWKQEGPRNAKASYTRERFVRKDCFKSA